MKKGAVETVLHYSNIRHTLKNIVLNLKNYHFQKFMKWRNLQKNSQTDFAKKCLIRKLRILQATFATNDVAIFV